MEEVWKNIIITSLPNTPRPHNHSISNNDHIIHHPTPTTNYRSTILQDFLNSSPSFSIPSLYPHHHHQQQESHSPTTALNLNIEFEPFDSSNYEMQGTQNMSAFGTFDGLAPSCVLPTSGGCGGGAAAKKRSSQSTPDENVSVDRRQKRMMKNRESASRSRARKEAYITELELEVSHLAQENARLRKQQQQQLLEAPSTQPPKKHGLCRTSTAPF